MNDLLFFILFLSLLITGVAFISLFYLLAVRQLILHGRLQRILPLPFCNPWRLLAGYRDLCREQKRPLIVWRLLQLLLYLLLVLLAAMLALVGWQHWGRG